MKKIFLLTMLILTMGQSANAQRSTDRLNRGLVAVPTGSTSGSTSNLVSWRRLADEYYDVTYNVYKNGTLVAENLDATSYTDAKSAPPTTQYQVAAVVNGVEQSLCDAITPWTQYVYKLNETRTPTGYLDIALATVYDRDGNDVTANYSPNDAEVADLDGDGDLEIIIKRLNTVDASISDLYGEMYSTQSNQFVVFDAYDVNWQTGAATLMWRIDCGPNMVSINSTQSNVIAYDWDGDGSAEVVFRGADNMIVYGSDGITKRYTIGDMSVNLRNQMRSHTDEQYAWTHTGNEYLLYINGKTGALYQKMTYPLKRLESGETSEEAAWGDNYGHRSTKHYMAAPFLDGRHASLFLARGIYSRHKMMALDLNTGSHTWSTRWTWNCKDSGSSWFAQGNHNFVIADVDEDGRDEIVFGSMTIDDNGKGLSTTGLGHGDALHVSDFDPYRKGLEVFACNEDSPNNNYRNATTSEIYYRSVGSKDDGRAMMGNFSSTIPGCIGTSVIDENLISSVADKSVGAAPTETGAALFWSRLNFRIYWDGDLGSEILDSPGTASEAAVFDHEHGRLLTTSGCNMNNDSKNNPCFQGDIIGDWREEIILRCGTNLRVYTTGLSTDYSLPCLWYDHQYRQAMVWQMMEYNQPPHLSYFLGELEGLTAAPPVLTNTGRTEVANGGTINNTLDGKHLLMAETNDMTVSVSEGAAPYILTVNTPSWVQGNDDNSNITTTTYTHTLTGSAFTGEMRLVKQGDGTLVLPHVVETYTGETNIWAGTLQFDGTLQRSPLWLNRFATLVSDGGTFGGGITADYGSRLIPGGESQLGSLTTTTLTLNHGARLVLDVTAKLQGDQVNANNLVLNTKTDEAWVNYGPKYLKPVIEIVADGTLSDGTWDLGAIANMEGQVSDLLLEGIDNAVLNYSDGHLWLIVGTGISATCSQASISEKTLQATDEGILLPVLDITPVAFSNMGNMVTPTLTAVFTDREGNQSDADIVKTLFSEDFEGSTTVGDYWKNSNEGSSIFTPTYDQSEGQCIGIRSATDRGDYMPIAADYTGVTAYTMEFDAYFNNATKTTDFVVMSKSHFSSWTYNYGYRWKTNKTQEHNPFLLYLQRAASSTTFTVNETDETITLDNATWYHFVLNVDVAKATVNYAMMKKGDSKVVASGSYTLPEGESAECDGIYIRNGRYNYEPGGAGIDNVNIYATDAYQYTFTRPGVLTVTSSAKGCTSKAKDYAAHFVGVKIGATGYTTLGCNYALDLSSVNAYVATERQTGYLTLNQVNKAPAATGLLLRGSAGTYRLPIVNGASSVGVNLLKAVTAAEGYTVTTDDIFAFANLANGAGFYQCNQGVVVPVGKAYLQVPSANCAFFGIDETTGISELKALQSSDSPYYDLQGRRLMSPRKGIYIQGNKKVVIK